MARIATYNLTDDLDEGKRLQSNQAVRITVTDRDEVWIVDTARRHTYVTALKAAGLKQAKRGRKAGSATEPSSDTDATDAQEGTETDAS